MSFSKHVQASSEIIGLATRSVPDEGDSQLRFNETFRGSHAMG
jgi:hypothetical protein